jgi:hypothetical protein
MTGRGVKKNFNLLFGPAISYPVKEGLKREGYATYAEFGVPHLTDFRILENMEKEWGTASRTLQAQGRMTSVLVAAT